LYPNLKLQIWRAGIRQNRLAQILGLDETTLSRIVNGFRRPGEDLKARIAAVLKSDQAWLFEESIRNVPTELPAEKGPLAG
jgi:transcriptional regulator with XRE-family HTH domain